MTLVKTKIIDNESPNPGSVINWADGDAYFYPRSSISDKQIFYANSLGNPIGDNNLEWDYTNQVLKVMGSLGLGTSYTDAILTVMGNDSSSGNFAFKAKNSSSDNLLSLRNDASYMSMLNDYLQLYHSGYTTTIEAAYATLALKVAGSVLMDMIDGAYITTYLPLHIGNGGLYGGTAPLSINTGIGGSNGLSEIAVQNVALGGSTGATSISAIGLQGHSTSGASATMRFTYDPVSFGISIDSTDPNHYRVGIGTDVEEYFRVVISDGLKVYGTDFSDCAIEAIGVDDSPYTYAFKAKNASLDDLLLIRNDGILIAPYIPTSNAGLPPKAIWSNGGTLTLN